MGQRLRVAHVGTGRTGRLVLEQILNAPGLELVGLYAHTPGKAGRDAGELIGLAPMGISATSDFDQFVAVDADCVTYLATSTARPITEVVDEHCAILAAGTNVVSTALGDLVHPQSLGEPSLVALQVACARGGSSLIAAGIAPGFAMDVLALHVATLSSGAAKVTVSERILCGSYSAPGFFESLGFGTHPDGRADDDTAGVQLFGSPIRLMAHELGWRLDELRGRRDIALADKDFECPAGNVPAGTVASVRITAEGVVDGAVGLSISEIWSLTTDVVDDWDPRPTPDSPKRLTRIVVDGSPSVRLDLALDGGVLPGANATAARVVNSIPAVCEADVGVHGATHLPIGPAVTNAR